MPDYQVALMGYKGLLWQNCPRRKHFGVSEIVKQAQIIAANGTEHRNGDLRLRSFFGKSPSLVCR